MIGINLLKQKSVEIFEKCFLDQILVAQRNDFAEKRCHCSGKNLGRICNFISCRFEISR
jgi:hypothetical protein